MSDLVLHCLPLSHKKDVRLLWVKPLSPLYETPADSAEPDQGLQVMLSDQVFALFAYSVYFQN